MSASLPGSIPDQLSSLVASRRRSSPWVFAAIVAGATLDTLIPSFTGKTLLQDLTAAVTAFILLAFAFHAARELRSNGALDQKQGPWWRLIQISVAAWGLLFVALWGARWLNEQLAGVAVEQPVRYHTFLQAAFLMSAITVGMESRRVLRRWNTFHLTPVRLAFILYGMTLILGTLLLILPFSLKPEASIRLIDALFTSVSALSVTGLTSINFTSTFSLAGQGIVMLLIQIGGLGIVTLSAGLALLTRKRLSLSQSLMGQELYDVPSVGGITPFLRRVLFTTLASEFCGAILLYYSLPAELPLRSFHALFLAVSAFCNAGFSSFPENLNIPDLTAAKTVVAALILIGGAGFPILFELSDFVRRKRRRFSEFAVLTCTVNASLLVIGAVGIFLAESLNAKEYLEPLSRFGQSLFYSVSARTAGFNLLPVGSLAFGSQMVLISLMVIGGAPVSTAGGIKTTTAGVIIVSALSILRGHKWIQFRRCEIPAIVLQKAITVAFLYGAVVFTAILLMVALEPLDPWALSFEVVSAASTVGLSMGVTEQLGAISKLLLIGLMISGRMGLVLLVYMGLGKITNQRYRYPPEKFYVG